MNITIVNPGIATDNCPRHVWYLIDEGTWQCSYCGAIGKDEDATPAPGHQAADGAGTAQEQAR